jgi:tetratricopeptide (TPR) repeat protein
LENLAIIRADGQDSDTALFYYNLALENSLNFQSNGDSFTSKLYGDIGSDLQISRLYGDIGSVLHDQGDLKGAEEHYERSLQILSKDPKKYELAMSSDYFNMGTLHQDQERFDEALKMFQQSVDIRQRHLHPYHPLIASVYLRMVDPSLRQRQFVKAEEYSRKGIELYLKSQPVIDGRFAKYYYERALSFQGLESYGEALKYAEKALEIAKRYSMPTEDYEAAVQGLKLHV